MNDLVTGLTVDELFTKYTPDKLLVLDRKELAKLVGRGVSAMNKRIRRLLKAGIDPHLKDIPKDGKFSVKGKSKREILKEFERMKSFYNKKTSTVRGYKKTKKKVEKVLDSLTEDKDIDQDKFWDAYKRLYKDGDLYEHFKYESWNAIMETLANNPDVDLDDPEEMADLREKAQLEIFGNIDITTTDVDDITTQDDLHGISLTPYTSNEE